MFHLYPAVSDLVLGESSKHWNVISLMYRLMPIQILQNTNIV